jgi:8-oxo-dGTP pyrophosphatase MutT (NUDIX family)
MNKSSWEETIEWARVVVGCIVYKNKKYLMVQEKQKRAYGLWNLPAGHVDKGESLEHAAIREAKEETGYEVRLVQEVGIYQHSAQSPVKHAFLAEVTGGSAHAQEDEILQVKWLSYEEIKDLYTSGKIRSEWIWQAINDHRKLGELGT